MKVLKTIVLGIFSLIGSAILILVSLALIVAIQAKLFLPQEYIMWIFKYPISKLITIYVVVGFYFIAKKIFYFKNKHLRKDCNSKKSFIKNHKKTFISTLVLISIVLIYTILFDVTVITNNKVIDYTFLSPRGKEYSFKNIVEIDTGVYGKIDHSLFEHYSKGDFYYIIQLNDGTKINLTDESPTATVDDPTYHTYSNIEKLDSQYINMGIPKVSSMDNIEFSYLGKIYTDKMRKILLNIKR